MDSSGKILLWRLSIIFAALFVAGKIVSVNTADFYMHEARRGDESAVDKALWWDEAQPRALTLKGQSSIR